MGGKQTLDFTLSVRFPWAFGGDAGPTGQSPGLDREAGLSGLARAECTCFPSPCRAGPAPCLLPGSLSPQAMRVCCLGLPPHTALMAWEA